MKNIMRKIFDLFYCGKQRSWAGIRNSFAGVFSYLYVKIYFFIILAVNIMIWLIARFIKANIGAEQAALHYNVDFGIDYYGSAGKIYIIPLLGLVIVLINFSLFAAVSGHKDRKFISHILFTAALASNLVLFVAIVSVYLVNFR